MISILDWETGLILLLQDSANWVTQIMELFTWLGYPQAYMIIIAIIYWAFDRELGLRLAIFLTLTASINSLLKQLIHAPRPYWTDPTIAVIHADSGFGMPSGHAQSSTVWLLAGAYLKRKWFWGFVVSLAFGVGLSRAYLGVHFPSQIVIGWLTGILLIIIFLRLEVPVLDWLNRIKPVYQMLFVLGCSFMIIFIGAVFISLLNIWEMPAEWTKNASANRIIDHAGLKTYGMISVAGNAGGFLGVGLGAIFMHRGGGFHEKGNWWIRLLRILIGLLCLASMFIGVQSLSPENSGLLIRSGWRFFGFFLVSFSAIFLLPLLFVKLRLLKKIN